MDDDNPPMLLPNYEVVSTRALEGFERKGKDDEEILICQITGKEYKRNEIRRVFLTS